MNETYKKLLLGVLSALIVFLGIFFIIRPANEETKKIVKETADMTLDMEKKNVTSDITMIDSDK